MQGVRWVTCVVAMGNCGGAYRGQGPKGRVGMMRNAISRHAPRSRRTSLVRAAAGLLFAIGLLAPPLSGSPLSGSPLAGAAEAATVGFRVEGEWSAVKGGDRVAGKGSDKLSWGGLSKNRRSAYVFAGLNPTLEVGIPSVTPVVLGRFTHKNFRIPDGSGIKGATLDVDIDVSVDGTTRSLAPLSFALKHWETDNRASPCANGEPNRQGVNSRGCADRIQFTSSAFDATTFMVDGKTYRVRVAGFFEPGSTTPLGTLWTKEENDNVAELRGEITAVPLPAAGLFLIGGMGGLGFLAARRRRC